MSEEKKEGFTFSDKIKNSKPAFNPFSKRAVSKVGANGKPKKTLFERTRRDAPFFIAALAALLLLPFLYKYSGNVDENTFVRPIGTDAEYIPERFDYDPAIGVDQVEQLTARDPMCLIAGMCKDTNTSTEETVKRYAPLRDRDSIDDYASASNRKTTTSTTVRRIAPKATRAAIQRAPTAIKELRSAGLNARGGGGLGSRFGGANLRAAAREKSSGGPRTGTKPVSLQPLRPVGNPSRSYFGQGGAAQARASRDAMSKSDATQALKDAMYNPVENRRLGGLTDGVFAAGGGAGKWDRTMDFKGITPWWWDMMKDQEMKKWEWEYFLWRKNLVEPLIAKLAEVLANIGAGMLNCLITGEDDGSMGSMGRRPASDGTPGNCEINGTKYETSEAVLADFPNLTGLSKNSVLKKWCESQVDLDAKDRDIKKIKWNRGEPAHGKLSWLGNAWHCMSGYAGRLKDIDRVYEQHNCSLLDNEHIFVLTADGDYSKWKYRYHAVIVENNPIIYTTGGTAVTAAEPLCNPKYMRSNRHVEGDNDDSRKGGGLKKREVSDNQCVIYVAKGNSFDYNQYKGEVKELLKVNGVPDNEEALESAFASIRPVKIEGYVMEQPMGTAVNGNWISGLPTLKQMKGGMPYAYFLDQYVYNRTGIFGVQQERNANTNFWTKHKNGGGMVSHECEWHSFNIKAHDIGRQVYQIKGTLTFDTDRYPITNNGPQNLTVRVKITNTDDGQTLFDYGEVPADQIILDGCDPSGVCYYHISEEWIGRVLLPRGQQVASSKVIDGKEVKTFNFRAHWKAVDNEGAESVDTADGTTDKGGEPPTDPNRNNTPQCTTDEVQTFAQVSANCQAVVPCVNGRYQFARMQLTGCEPDPNGNGIERMYTLAESMDKIATDLRQHFYVENRSFSQPAGDMHYTQFKSDAANQDLAQLNAARVNVNGVNNSASRDFINEVVDKINNEILAADPVKSVLKPVADDATPTLSEFTDALHLASLVNVNQVSKQAVCEFARGVMLASNDPAGDRDLHNEFGTFLSYISLDAGIYAPNQKRKTSEGDEIMDQRFIYTRPLYWWGGYELDQKGHRTCETAKAQIEATGFPLSDLYDMSTEGSVKAQTAKHCPDTTRNAGISSWALSGNRIKLGAERQYEADCYRSVHVATYNKKLIAGDGQCNTLEGDMNVSDAIRYIDKVIELGLSYKPESCGKNGEAVPGGHGTAGGRNNATK